jgi:hypothetical protein
MGLVFAMAQTPDGYLWVAGLFGLYRFDGLRFVQWQPPGGQSLPGGPYSLLGADPQRPVARHLRGLGQLGRPRACRAEGSVGALRVAIARGRFRSPPTGGSEPKASA